MSDLRLLAGLAIALTTAAAAPAAGAATPSLSRAQTAYAESCGGCHGLQGLSARDLVPQLRDRAGYFLCTSAARAYVVHLPNVAYASRSDEDLADLLNFMAFDLGGASAPRVATPYTAEEVGRLRRERHAYRSLRAERKAIVSNLGKGCAAPADFEASAEGY